MRSAPFLAICVSAAAALFCSCQATSLSDPDGRGHQSDLNLFELTGQSADQEVSEAAIVSARAGRQRLGAGTLPKRGARVLLVQSGAHQPDEELRRAFSPHCEAVSWNGRVEGRSPYEKQNEPEPGSAGRRLRLVAAQQGCSHVIVIFGEIQSRSRKLPTTAVSWLPGVDAVLPARHSSTRLLAQAIILETATPRYSLLSADPRETSGITTDSGADDINSRRSMGLKSLAYADLAGKSFR